jgi:type II secretory pathway component PulF
MAKYKWDNLILFVEQLSSAATLKIPLDKTIDAMSREALDRRWKGVQVSISELVRLGSSLSEAMNNYPQYFPGMVRRLVRAGEEGNVLPTMLRSVSRYLQVAREVQHRLQRCMIYPFFVWTILLIDAIILFVWAVPRLADMYNSLGASLPPLTRSFINVGPALLIVGNGLLFYLAWIVIGFIGTDVEGKSWASGFADRIILYIPFFSALHRHAKAAQVCDMLGALIEGGRPAREALTVARGAIISPSLQAALDDVDAAIAAGESYTPTERKTLVPQATLWMLAQADATPDLGKTLQNLSQYHRRQLDMLSSMVREILEPLLLLAVGILGALGIVSLYMPIFQMATNILG